MLYPDQMFQNGLFNPICPFGYNFLTVYIADKNMSQRGLNEYILNGRVNGTVNFQIK